MNDSEPSKMPLKEWVCFFKEYILSADVNDEVAESLIKHLVDLGAMDRVDDDFVWHSYKSENNSSDLLNTIQKNLILHCESDSGFALPYFIGFENLSKKPLESITSIHRSNPRTSVNNPSQNTMMGPPASDLSNLQIVKKVGKQLQPFLQLEETLVTRLIGKHVCKQDAQKLFHYMFAKIGVKAKPRTWEQLSRKKHR
jgi:hypothetical protein